MRSLNLSHASYRGSKSICLNWAISPLNYEVLDSGKNLVKNFYANSFYEPILLGCKDWSHPLALSLRENRNNLIRITSSITPFNLIVSQISKNVAK